MILREVTLSCFRPFAKKTTFAFHPQKTIISGPNAHGKTSLLEAIYMLHTGTGFREWEEIELLTIDTADGYIRGDYGDDIHREVVYVREGESLRKKYFREKSPTSLAKYRQAQSPIVLFAPQQLDIIVGSPTKRREYLNAILCQTDRAYAQALKDYETALRKRNSLLEYSTDPRELRVELEFWDEYMDVRSGIITAARHEYVQWLMREQKVFDYTFTAQYVRNDFTTERATEKFVTESQARRTLIGPQKDDILILMGDREVARYSSRSQERSALLWLKMREIAYLEHVKKEKPILLLDDVFSEFDLGHRELLYRVMGEYQTVATTTEKEIGELVHGEYGVIEL